MNKEYALLDSGQGFKLEQFGDIVLARPCAHALWRPFLKKNSWDGAHASFSRESKQGWRKSKPIPEEWVVSLEGLFFKISLTDFGHLGLFPEHSFFWKEMASAIQGRKTPVNVLNLFAYSGGATLAAAKAGASVCHLDASKGMVAWARENAKLNRLDGAKIRWIIDDVTKFLKREVKRGVRYDAVILDPPSFGRGAQGEVFKIEEALPEILQLCRELLSDHPLFVILSTHTAGMSPLALHHIMTQMMEGMRGSIQVGEMKIQPKNQGWDLPCGSFAKWMHS